MRIKKILGKLIAVLAVTLLLLSSVLVALRLDRRPRTDDAFVYADTAAIAPEVSGRMIALNIRNNQSVHEGDVLFVIDPDQYQYKLDATEAQLRLTSLTLARMEPLLSKGYVTAEKIDEAPRVKKECPGK